MVADLRQVAAEDPTYPPILFVFQGSVAKGEEYFSDRWADVRAIADPRRRLYSAFGIKRGSMKEVFGLGAIRASTRAMREGHTPSKPVGDTQLMPGMFLVHGEYVLWQHHFKHIGDHPDFKRIPGMAAELLVYA